MNLEQVATPLGSSPQRFFNRELSWLEFNARVLAQAEDPHIPLLERVKFLAIFSENLDEFFRVRVAGLREQLLEGLDAVTPDGRTPRQQLDQIDERVNGLVDRQARVFVSEVCPALDEAGIRFPDWTSLAPEDEQWLGEFFLEHVFPVLTPLAVDPSHPFPYISDLSLNLAVVVRDPVDPEVDGDRELRFARVKVPPSLPRFVRLPDGQRFVAIERIIGAYLDRLFPAMEIVGCYPFRVTRDAELDVDDEEADDLLEAMETVLRRRRSAGRTVRLEVEPGMAHDVLELLIEELELERSNVDEISGPLGLSGLWEVYRLSRPELKDPLWEPLTAPELHGIAHHGEFFNVIRRRDVLVHHPYESFTTSVEAFIEAAAADPDVLAIKQTLYRTSIPESPIVTALMEAAAAGKQVVALVELKARFDEVANIRWARALEQAGVHVVYGVLGLKTHAKLSLVVRQEGGTIRRYTHVGTGNYHPRTATIYEDVGIFTADDAIGEDVSDLFNSLTGYSRKRRYRRLLVAPTTLRDDLLRLIAAEAARPDGRIVCKMNSLVDPAIIDALYRASGAGTQIDLIVRGICCLRPGVPGLSEHIRVKSIVGRFLEHSRIYAFGPDPLQPRPRPRAGESVAPSLTRRRGRRYYIGSADLMPRNLDRRVETLVPVLDRRLRQRIEAILNAALADDCLSWLLGADGSWERVPGGGAVNSHLDLQQQALARAHRRTSTSGVMT